VDFPLPAQPAGGGGSSQGRLSRPAFTTADLCDAYAGEVRVVQPIFRDFGGTRAFAGPAETVRVVEDNTLVRRLLETDGRGRVLVVDGGGSLRCALVGGRLAALAAERGWSGIVVNGCVRDSAELGRALVGVKALGVCPMRSGRNGNGEQGVHLTFAGVSWKPGDFIYGDEDGLLLASRQLVDLSSRA
jgi:regulator of ribonuclease activity A